ncbi:PH domain-containing protein [Parasphingorhabdus sp.]|uniref:PH domain-containing protein n=1 Tax=Parasphingorhabdus sp. TaxID=2709688 RepID=UPI0032641DB7
MTNTPEPASSLSSAEPESGLETAVSESQRPASYNQGLTPLHPAHKTLIRLNRAITAIVLLILATVAEFALRYELPLPLPAGILIGPMLVFAFVSVFILPGRIYRRWGYDMGDEQLRILRGFLWRTDTIVPFNRIQHIDVAQGPLQRMFGLSTLIVHTAGTHNSIVTLPGLATADAERMRDTIKGHIRQDMI